MLQSKKNELNILDLSNSFLNLKNFSKVYLEDVNTEVILIKGVTPLLLTSFIDYIT